MSDINWPSNDTSYEDMMKWFAKNSEKVFNSPEMKSFEKAIVCTGCDKRKTTCKACLDYAAAEERQKNAAAAGSCSTEKK
ncbi:hypothetical protein AAVH_21374 [Aphelenchoides avenae]|nr:hypothetical protein AAVH_21374 [Aphelenchus avenae]